MAIDTPSTETAAAPAAKKPQAAFKVSLEHFATKLSGNDKRVALIHGFVHSMKATKKFRDTHENYHAAYHAYANTPFKHRATTTTAPAAKTK